MELISLEHINEQYLSYSDLRSVKKYLSSKNIPIIKMGKNYFVNKAEFENLIIIKGNKNKIIQRGNKSKLDEKYRNIYSDLLGKL